MSYVYVGGGLGSALQLALMGHQQDGGRFEGCRARRESGIRAIAPGCASRHRRTQSMRVALRCCDARVRSASKIAVQGPRKRGDGGGKTAPRGCESREGKTPWRSVSSVLVLGESPSMSTASKAVSLSHVRRVSQSRDRDGDRKHRLAVERGSPASAPSGQTAFAQARAIGGFSASCCRCESEPPCRPFTDHRSGRDVNRRANLMLRGSRCKRRHGSVGAISAISSPSGEGGKPAPI